MVKRKKKSKVKAKSKTRAAEEKSKNKAIWITASATIVAAIVTVVLTRILVDGKKPMVGVSPIQKTKVVEVPFFLKLDDPVMVWPKAKGSEYGYTKPPKIQIIGRGSNALEEDALCAQFGKASFFNGTSLPEVDNEYMNCKLGLGNRRLKAIFDSESFIRSEYAKAPHGQYRGLFKITDQRCPENQCKSFDFNYVYQEDFQDLTKALSTKKGKFTNISEIAGGLQITKLTDQNAFVYAYLNQEFDFKTGFCINGIFTMESDDHLNPCSFDISLCDRWGEKISVIFADGLLNDFTIKKLGEKYGKEGVTKKSDKFSIALSRGSDIVMNFFKVRFKQYEKEVKCSLYLRQNDPVTKSELPVHERMIYLSAISQDFISIHLKLWKVGQIKLYALEIAEVPKD